ncbi:site-specific integrase [Actinosynnema mirum]|uniref:Integrase family protein n=1 Tax=Actinosynnema mirum (strain ATCC 29888 / DSM 43827 / JCM 3225 / NBRC 14064 / NCIMB 13271 / NRRL B-12336 / IMRU 3971 / 101) TaxID=446462 RepID=C6WC74_ACTMD|nr:tyrosine-type recombinase/integrase [Actinosynnema mirum]ACU39462.1 integrase family protein [Actinosynnema mirum DSM 43827]
MARPSLEIGTYGDISCKQQANGSWRAHARYRGSDGVTRPLHRFGPTERKAISSLKKALGEALSSSGVSRSAEARVRFAAVAQMWIDRIKRDNVGTTYDRYRGRLDKHILPAMGNLYIQECTPARIKRVLEALRHRGMATATIQGIRTVISGVLQEAVDLEVVHQNSVRHMARLASSRRNRKKASFDSAQLTDFLARVDGDTRARRADMPDFLRVLFGTGARFGEVLAIRWGDLNLGDVPVRLVLADGSQETVPAHSAWINGNLVHVTGQGVVRHEGKTATSVGVLALPDVLWEMLVERRPAVARPETPVFPSATGGWRGPSNVQRTVRLLRDRIGYRDFTLRVGRRTVATALDAAGHTAREVAGQLRHSRPSTTQDVYMSRVTASPALALSLDKLLAPAAPKAMPSARQI